MKKKTEKKKLVLAKETMMSLCDREEMMKEVFGGYTEMSCQWACFATRTAESNCVC